MALQLQNTATLAPRFSHWFFHGLTRSGKTIAASTFPTPIFLIPTGEGSHVSLLGRSFDLFEIAGPREMDEALSLLEARYEKAKRFWAQKQDEQAIEAFPWETVVVESLTHYCDSIVEEFTRGGKTQMDRREWGKLSAHLRNLRARLLRLPVHVVFVALSKTVTDNEQNVIVIEPSFPGAMTEKLPSACDVVVYFERKPGSPRDLFTAHFNRAGKALAGSRYDALTKTGQLRPFSFEVVEKILGWNQD